MHPVTFYPSVTMYVQFLVQGVYTTLLNRMYEWECGVVCSQTLQEVTKKLLRGWVPPPGLTHACSAVCTTSIHSKVNWP